MTARSFEVRRLIVVDTCIVCRGRDPEPTHFEIHLAEDDGPNTPHQRFVTRDAALYTLALAVEGTGQRVDGSWRLGQRADRKPAQVLYALRLAGARGREVA